MLQNKKGQGLPLNTIIIAIIVIVVLVVIILIFTGQIKIFQDTVSGACVPNAESKNYCSYTGECGAGSSPNAGLECPVGGTCCEVPTT